jgi:hypothetical protein
MLVRARKVEGEHLPMRSDDDHFRVAVDRRAVGRGDRIGALIVLSGRASGESDGKGCGLIGPEAESKGPCQRAE